MRLEEAANGFRESCFSRTVGTKNQASFATTQRELKVLSKNAPTPLEAELIQGQDGVLRHGCSLGYSLHEVATP
jgi:hypothetical protein